MSFLLLLSLLTAEARPLKGTLCFSEGRECVTTSGTRLELAAQEFPRPFVWTSEDVRTVILGELAAGERVIDLDLQPRSDRATSDDSPRTVTLTVRGQASRGWPAGVQFTLTQSKEKRWKWTLPPESTRGETKVHLPAGSYVLVITAPRHRSELRRIRIERNIDLGSIELKPLPSISGRVTRAEEEELVPVAGAQIVLGDGTVATATNEQGFFRAELREPVPKELLVVSAGSGSHVVLLERLEAENDLGEIRLESGATLTLRVDRPDDLRSKTLRVRLLRKNEQRYEPSERAKSELPAGDEEKAFADLSPGEYYVILEGEEQLQRLLVPVTVGKEDVTKTIEIRPFELEGRVMFGDEPLREGSVGFSPHRHGATWRAQLPIDSEGRFGGVLWQTGRLSGFVQRTDGAGGILHAESPEMGSNPSKWTMSFKKRAIHGRIFDRESGDGVGDFSFQLRTATKDGSRGYSSVRVAQSGQYEIMAWQDGTYDLAFNARDYLPTTKSVELSDLDGSKQLDIALERGSNVTLEFVWPFGQRIVGAAVLEGVARDGHNPERMHSLDATGRLALRVASDQTRLLYVLPQEGSFAPVRVAATRSEDDQPVRVTIPQPAGALKLRVRDAEGNDAVGLVVMRYNGEWIPYPVTGRLRKSVSPGFIEFTALPPGAYELWAIAPRPGLRGIPSTPPMQPPVRVGLGTGEASAELTVLRVP